MCKKGKYLLEPNCPDGTNMCLPTIWAKLSKTNIFYIST